MAIKLFKWLKHSEPKQTEEMIKQNINPVKPNEPVKPVKARKKQQDSHLYTKVITYCPAGIVILISYTEEYFYSMIEFLGLLNGTSMSAVTMKSSYDQDSGKVDKYGEPIMISHDRYYMVFSTVEADLYYIYHESINLGNEFIEAITQDIYDTCNPFSFNDACNDGILDNSQFKYNINEPMYNAHGFFYDSDVDLQFTYMNGYNILKELPDCFTVRDILDLVLVKVESIESGEWDYTTTLYEILHDYKTEEIKDLTIYRPIFEALLNRTVSEQDYTNLSQPRYLFDDDPYEDDNGKMTDEELDDIFKETYEKFSAVSSNDVQYEDIDEEITEEDILADDKETTTFD